ncbi:hypothetical protein K4L06_07255 [Lysobacter sp. BMK333-48F3]|uniref:hypothetical protein n=1 Tax=Lysobacter sp. BMK333-48F3 TaxID=2867962 RepID=UPI001C8BD281|nr:hypothetical protein [Lysobacter sp. BMK333-48F3]MBX9401107.1 hypothetical protein [Lysobacter sp. BMK333-48F3]
MRLPALPAFALVAALSGCGSVEYRDTNAAVDARPECTSGPQRPGESPPAWCERKLEAKWGSSDNSEPVDFKQRDERR